jgi:gluconate 2-dehydrogenase gamma chain
MAMSIEEAVEAYVQGRMDRGEFISALRGIGVMEDAALGYALVLGATQGRTTAAPGDISPPESPDEPGGRTAEELQIVEAIASRIVPTTETPGAAEAGAGNYIQQALTDAYRPLLPRYCRGLRELDVFCASTLGAGFALLRADQQDTVLSNLAGGKIAEVDAGADFFQLVRRHVLEGMFCEPSYGGNQGLVGWSLVGFPGQRYGYPDPYINRAIDLQPVAADGAPQKEV